MKKLALALLTVFLLSAATGGCAKIGQTTGKIVKDVKEAPREFKDGYKEGRSGQAD